MRNTVPTSYTAVPTGVTKSSGHVRRNQRSRCRNPSGHVHRNVGHDPGITGHVEPEYSPGWQLRIVDGNHLPGSQKRLAPLRGHRGAALPGHALVVYDPDLAQVVDLVACEDAYESERTGVMPLFDSAAPGQIWIADRHFCTRTILQRCCEAGASFIVRQHGKHPVIVQESPWREAGRCETGQLREQTVQIDEAQAPWRRIELKLDQPTDSGESTLWLWSNLPESIRAEQIAALYRRRWSIEGMFGRLESVLNSEITTLGHPRAALLGFTVAVPLAYNMLSLIKRYVWSTPIARRRRSSMSPPTTWPSMSGAPTQACSSPCLQRTGRTRPRALIRWCSACWLWPAASSPDKWPRASAAPRSKNPRAGSRQARLGHMFPRPGCSRQRWNKDLERGACQRAGNFGLRKVAHHVRYQNGNP